MQSEFWWGYCNDMSNWGIDGWGNNSNRNGKRGCLKIIDVKDGKYGPDFTYELSQTSSIFLDKPGSWDLGCFTLLKEFGGSFYIAPRFKNSFKEWKILSLMIKEQYNFPLSREVINFSLCSERTDKQNEAAVSPTVEFSTTLLSYFEYTTELSHWLSLMDYLSWWLLSLHGKKITPVKFLVWIKAGSSSLYNNLQI